MGLSFQIDAAGFAAGGVAVVVGVGEGAGASLAGGVVLAVSPPPSAPGLPASVLAAVVAANAERLSVL
jgi:hypothetical protein